MDEVFWGMMAILLIGGSSAVSGTGSSSARNSALPEPAWNMPWPPTGWSASGCWSWWSGSASFSTTPPHHRGCRCRLRCQCDEPLPVCTSGLTALQELPDNRIEFTVTLDDKSPFATGIEFVTPLIEASPAALPLKYRWRNMAAAEA